MRMKRLMLGLVGVLTAALLVSCEAVFTFSPLKSFQRNPANMTPAQQVAYAEQALQSGDPATMKAAYDTIKNSTNPQTNLLAGELAFGASGASDALTKALADVASGASISSLQTELNTVDINLATQGAQSIMKASAGGATVSDSQYAIASASYAVAAAQQAGGFDKLSTLTSGDPGYADLQQAKNLVSSITSPDLTSTLQSIY